MSRWSLPCVLRRVRAVVPAVLKAGGGMFYMRIASGPCGRHSLQVKPGFSLALLNDMEAPTRSPSPLRRGLPNVPRGDLPSPLPKKTQVQLNWLHQLYWFPWKGSEQLLVRSQLLWRRADKVSQGRAIYCGNHWRCFWRLLLTTSGCHHILDTKLTYLPECCFPLLFHASFFLPFSSI